MDQLKSRRDVLKGAVGAGIAGLCGPADNASGASAPRPNILFLLADDLRFDAVGYLNKDVQTPNLDRIAAEGLRFLNTFVTTSICCTSRASIFTGTYARHHNIWDFTTTLSPTILKNSYPALLRNAGYRTGSSANMVSGIIRSAMRLAMESAYCRGCRPRTLPGSMSSRISIAIIIRTTLSGNITTAGWSPKKAENFIRTTRPGQPFCLSLSFKAPHANDVDDLIMGQYVAEPDLLPRYARDIFTEGPTMNEAAFQTLPDFLRNSESRRRWQGRFSTPWLWQDSVRKYYALVTGIDRTIGRIMKVLAERGMLDNTVFIFTSDNGYFLGDYGLSDKWYGYEASIRVPLVIRPAGKPISQNILATTLNIDLAPTILKFAGVPIPPSMRGWDLSPLWGRPSSQISWRQDFLYEHYLPGLTNPSMDTEKLIPSSEGVRNERYTYLRYPRQTGDNEQLFDRVGDPNELKNIIHTAPPELVDQLRQRTDELIAENA